MKKRWLQYNYEFSGLFYRGIRVNCRMVLDIRGINCGQNKPDLIVIMMNPGGSRPEDESYNFGPLQLAQFVPTHPDLTQWKVIDFMRRHGYKYARVFNLSDWCEPDNNKLEIVKFRDNSNFWRTTDRNRYFNTYFNGKTDMLLAWGCKGLSKVIIRNALNIIRTKNYLRIFGYQHPKEKTFFYHPLKIKPKKKSSKKEKYDVNHWLNGVKLLEETALAKLFNAI